MSDESRKIEAGTALCRADLHVHTRHSGGGHLRVPRLRQGLPEPEALYRAARARGRRHRCHVRRVFRKVQRKVAAILEQTTLEDILQATL